MTFTFRPQSTDYEIFSEVFTDNSYRVPAAFSPDDVMIDIGGHIGSFTYTVLKRGAGKVYTFEADPSNMECLKDNLKEYISQGKVVVENKAVYRSDQPSQQLFLGGYSVANGTTNTGGLGVIFPQQGQSVETVGLDNVISKVLRENPAAKRIRLLKIDCEGSEWPILMTAKSLSSIEEICGEFHELGGAYNTEVPPFTINGHRQYTADLLKKVLEENGFSVTCHRTRTVERKPTSCGLFFATRASILSSRYLRHKVRLNYMLKAKVFLDDWRKKSA
jgi:FkbM family methyltransferase